MSFLHTNPYNSVFFFSKYFSSRKKYFSQKKYKIGGGVVLIKMNHIPLTFLEYNNIYILMKLKEVKQDIHKGNEI